MIPRLIQLPTVSLVLLTSLLSITLLTGCPVAQQPTVPSQQDEDNQSQDTTVPDDGLDRPIPPPDIDDDTTTSDPGGSVPGDGGDDGDGGGGGQGSDELVLLSINEPSRPLAVRPGTVVSVGFELYDRAGSVESGELVIAHDDNNDGQPDDGDHPDLVQPLLTIADGSNTVAFNTALAGGWLNNNFRRFVPGIRVTTLSQEVTTKYAAATITIDGIEPTATDFSPAEDHLVSRGTVWTIQLSTSDNSQHSVRIMLDLDLTPESGNEYELVAETSFPAGTGTRTFNKTLSGYPSDTYYYYVIVSDGIDPPVAFYAEDPNTGIPVRLAMTNRLIGEFELDQLAVEPGNPAASKGAIMQGFNEADLAGSSMVSVPDVNGDGNSELLIAARFGKPNLGSSAGVGWGEAYLVYGSGGARLGGEESLNSVGGGIPGLTFRGIRVPQNSTHTEGLADIAVVEDMDGDELPEIAFSFPRVESLSLKSPAPFQHPDLLPDIPGMGNLEYDAVNPMTQSWINNVAQFTRGGIVIVSSHNQLLTDPGQVTRKFDRVLDLHEVGQMFSWMTRASLAPYIFDIWFMGAGCIDCADATPCDGEGEYETEYTSWVVWWDVWLGGG